MKIEKKLIRRCFSRAKNTYDQHCHFQLEICKRLIVAINRHAVSFSNILDIGCGTGLVTQILQNAYPHDFLMAIDMADELIKLAKLRLNSPNQVILADFDHIPITNQQFNLVFSNMALQWSMDFTATIAEIARVSQSSGFLAIALPVEGTFSELKQFLYCLTGHFYLNEFLNIKKVIEALLNSGYRVIDNEVIEYNFLFENLQQALQSIKRIGAIGNDKMLKLKINKSLYNKKFKSKLKLNYSIAYLVAVKTDLRSNECP